MTNLLDGQPVPLYGDGGNIRSWIHVDDHCRGIQGHDRRYSLDDGTLRSMGYALLVPFRQGLEETVRWYAGNRACWEPLKRPGAAPGAAGSGQMS